MPSVGVPFLPSSYSKGCPPFSSPHHRHDHRIGDPRVLPANYRTRNSNAFLIFFATIRGGCPSPVSMSSALKSNVLLRNAAPTVFLVWLSVSLPKLRQLFDCRTESEECFLSGS